MHNGLPHHGLMVVISFKFGLAILLWGAQLLVAIGVKNDFYALIFGLGNVVTNILICIDTWVLARIERGVTPEIHSDYDMSKKLKIGFVSGVALAVIALCLIGVYGYFHFLGDVDSNRLRNAHTEQEILASFRDHIAPDVTAGARLRLARHYAKSGRLVEARAQMKLLPDLAAWPELAKRSQIEQAFLLVCEGKVADARKLLENVADADTDADLQPLRVEAAVEAGKLALAANDAETARKYLDKSVKLQHQLTLYDNAWTAEAKKLLETLPAAKPAEPKK